MKIIDRQEVKNSDEKGIMMDLIKEASINSVSYITCKKGFVRGNHYHKYTTHYNYIISGKIMLVTQVGNHEPTKTILGKGNMYMTIPMEKHAYFALEDTELMVLAKGPSGSEEFESDTYPLWEPLIR
ncbi:MAG TPA: cupin domain-containing protein [Cytophagaceae bacterium]|jgi:quercetin dioxygenase-like cupin family protein|nr:cupin domain-containing protein [Cytophagaceae bacterium]